MEPLDKVDTWMEGDEEKSWIYAKWLMKATYRKVKERILDRLKRKGIDVPREVVLAYEAGSEKIGELEGDDHVPSSR